MPNDCVSYLNSGYFIPLINDYLDQQEHLKSLYSYFPTIENFGKQILDKQKSFSSEKRTVLVAELEKQYSKIEASQTTLNHIKRLNNSNTFTVTTGHQLNLFTGPLYFLYKIISTINLCHELKQNYPDSNFVPIYWMATEDHDFEEINYFNFRGKKFKWEKESAGAVGALSTIGLETFFAVFEKELGQSNTALVLKDLFQKAYLNHNNLADATRYLANELFGKQGLVILDANCQTLKKEFIPYLKNEIINQISNKNVLETIAKIKQYDIQVNPREINLFYLDQNLRERIILENGIYKINNTKLEFSENEILLEIENHPEKFSPNVILRPLYQEVILPNLCYIGGGGEIAYWLELKSNFDANNVCFPILLIRNSVLLVTEKQVKKADKLHLTWQDLFKKQSDLIAYKTKELSQIPIDFSVQKEHLSNQFKALYQIASQTDKSFLGAVKAQEVKQIKGLENLEKRLLKAQKRKFSEELARITDLQNELFPHQALQERQLNFSEFYLEFGTPLIEKLSNELKPLEQEFRVMVL